MTFENRNNDYWLMELLPYFWNSLWTFWKCCRTYKIDFGFPKLLSDHRNILSDFRASWPSSRTVAGSSGELQDSKNSCSIYGTQGFVFEGVGYNISEHHASRWKTTAVHYQLELMGLPLVEWPVAKFIVPNWGDKIDSGAA